jgi:NAD dependent epimerase/dehydratase
MSPVTPPDHDRNDQPTAKPLATVRGKRLLVTGAGGFIGSHLAERLVVEGAEVTCLVHYNARSSIGNLEHVDALVRQELRIEYGNIEDGDYVLRLADGLDAILHLAALIGIPFSYVSPRSYLRTNTEGTLNILEAARQNAVGRVVHTSTSEVYGTALRVPIDEEHPLQGQSPYSASKIGADKLAEAYARSFDLPVVTVRPFNTYGPRQSARAFITAVIVQALRNDVISLGNLHPKRDMTYVADTVDGFIRATTAVGIEGEVINLGSGGAQTVGEFVAKIQALLGIDKPIEVDPARVRPEASEVLNLVADNGKAQRLLGWRPSVSLNEGLRLTIDHVSRHLQTYNADRYAV